MSSFAQEHAPSFTRLHYRNQAHLIRYLQDLPHHSQLEEQESNEHRNGVLHLDLSHDISRDLSRDQSQILEPDLAERKRPMPRLLLMGQRRSGKSSIAHVVFHKLPPTDTMYLETTTKLRKDEMHSFLDFQVWEFPGHLNYFDPTFDAGDLLVNIGAIIWVIDAQDDYFDSIARLHQTIVTIKPKFPNIHIFVFVHKVDGLSDDYRQDVYQDIVHRVEDELQDAGYAGSIVTFFETSIYDHTIFQAFSKVIQKLIPSYELAALTGLLDSLVATCQMDKAYLFDILSKIYLAQDSSPADPGCYEVCSDHIDVVVDISEIYGWDEENTEQEQGNSDAESVILMHKKENCYVYLKEINRYLALICIMPEDSPVSRKAMIDYNVSVFTEAMRRIFPKIEPIQILADIHPVLHDHVEDGNI